MNFSPFSCPIFLGHPEARGLCSQGERVLYGRDLWCLGGAGKAEPAKLPGAGIGPQQCPGKWSKKKQTLPYGMRIAVDERTHMGGKSGEMLDTQSESLRQEPPSRSAQNREYTVHLAAFPSASYFPSQNSSF